MGHLSFVLEGSVQVLLARGACSWRPVGMNPHLELANTLLCYQGYTHTHTHKKLIFSDFLLLVSNTFRTENRKIIVNVKRSNGNCGNLGMVLLK